MKNDNYDPLSIEPEILEFWEKKKIYEKAKQNNTGNKKYYFLDGPPYTSGKVHIGTAWNKSLKDMVLRFKRMQGLDVWDRAGYDMHGLPTENATQKKLGLGSKKDIEEFGAYNFIEECRKLCIENMKVMNEDFKRLGVWMDFDNPYQTISKEFMEAEWTLIKTAHESGRIYQGFRSMAWDWEDQTALAKHELEYKRVRDKSIYVKMKTKSGDFLIIWTTTPWTIPFNLAIMVNPKLYYYKLKVNNEIWIVAKDLTEKFMELIGEKYEILEEVMGAELEGVEYEHPFNEELKHHYEKIKKEHPKTHTVVLSEEYVDISAGTGLVHVAPGCGPEDYEVGHRNSIPPWNTCKEDGRYDDSMGEFSGRHASLENSKFIEDLEAKSVVVAQQFYDHEYPHGERSKKPVIFRATKQWFFKVEDLKDHMRSENNLITWNPKAAYNAFDSWLANLRDNSISKQRYWGTPVPIWTNEQDENDYIVIGSAAELEKLSGKKVKDMHSPTVDLIEIKKDGKAYKRIPDVLDVWVDAGSASWASINYPHKKELFEEMFPADFILEGKDQIRGWFNLLMVASTLMFNKTSFKACYMHGFVQDSQGRKMSKSLGNYILPEEVVKEHGADTLRYYMISGANPGLDINYNFEDMKVKYRNLSVLWNIHKFLIEYAKNLKINPSTIEKVKLSSEEKYIISRLNSGMRNVNVLFEELRLNEVPSAIEEIFLDLSRTYMQFTREKSSLGSDEEKKAVLFTIYNVLLESLKMFACVCPFISERIYQNFKQEFKLDKESIHHHEWPSYDTKKIDEKLENDIGVAKRVIQGILNAREKSGLGVRWPIKKAIIITEFKDIAASSNSTYSTIMNHTNIKALEITHQLKDAEVNIKVDYGKLGPLYGKDIPRIISSISQSSTDSILKTLEKEGKYTLVVEDKKYELKKEHFIIEKNIPIHLIEADFPEGKIYIDTTRNEDLEAEGFAREIMRRIQDARKKAGLKKSDEIKLYLETDSYIEDLVKEWQDQIKEKVGAEKIELSSSPPKAGFKENHEFKIKGKNVVVRFSKV